MQLKLGVMIAVMGGSGCAASSTHLSPQQALVSAYMPLAKGYQWTYAVQYPGKSGRRTVRILRKDDDGYFVDNAGGAFKVTEQGLRDHRRFLIKTPITAGRYWSVVLSPEVVETYELVSVGRPCECLLGRFDDCLLVESKIRRNNEVVLRGRFSWARGVGLIKITTAAVTNETEPVPQSEHNLIGYRVGEVEIAPRASPVSSGTRPTGTEEDLPPWER